MSRASALPAPARRRQSFLARLWKPSEEEETRLQESEHTHDWYMIRDSDTGFKLFEISCCGRPVKTYHDTDCVTVGSNLYEIGGFDNPIRRIYPDNQVDYSIVTTKLPSDFANVITAVSGNFIYLFRNTKGSKTGQEPWAYMYDTIEPKVLELSPPDNDSCMNSRVSFCASYGGRGVLLSLLHDDGLHVLYLHKTDRMEWEKLGSIDAQFSNNLSEPFSISKGALYLYSSISGTAMLRVFKVKTGKLLPPIRIPKLDKLDVLGDTNIFLVPPAADTEVDDIELYDTELYIFWHKRPYWYKALYYANILVSFDSYGVGTASLLKQGLLNIDALGVISVLPYKSFLDGAEEECSWHKGKAVDYTNTKEIVWGDEIGEDGLLVGEVAGASSIKRETQELEEDEWMDRCLNAAGEMVRKMQELHRSLRKKR